MKTAYCLAALIALTPAVALGQFTGDTEPDSPFMEQPIYYKAVGGDTPDAVYLGEQVRLELEKSRQLNRVDMMNDDVMQIEAPLSMVKDAQGARYTVTYELRSARGVESAYNVTCPVKQLDRCADAIVRRAERLAREGIERMVR